MKVYMRPDLTLVVVSENGAESVALTLWHKKLENDEGVKLLVETNTTKEDVTSVTK